MRFIIIVKGAASHAKWHRPSVSSSAPVGVTARKQRPTGACSLSRGVQHTPRGLNLIAGGRASPLPHEEFYSFVREARRWYSLIVSSIKH